MRTLICALLVAALSVTTAVAQAPAPGTTTSQSQTAVTQDEIVLQGDTTPRPATPTFYGDTGLWFVPTAETLPGGRMSFVTLCSFTSTTLTLPPFSHVTYALAPPG